jgi:hypothetical protein
MPSRCRAGDSFAAARVVARHSGVRGERAEECRDAPAAMRAARRAKSESGPHGPFQADAIWRCRQVLARPRFFRDFFLQGGVIDPT